MAKSIKRSSGAKKAMATKRAKSGSNSKEVANAFVIMAKNGQLCLRRRTLGGGYVRGNSSTCNKVKVTTRGNKVIAYRDPIDNPTASKKITAARKKARSYKSKTGVS